MREWGLEGEPRPHVDRGSGAQRAALPKPLPTVLGGARSAALAGLLHRVPEVWSMGRRELEGMGVVGGEDGMWSGGWKGMGDGVWRL